MKNKRVETGVNIWDRTKRNWLNEMGFTLREAKRKPAGTNKQQKISLKWAKEKQSWRVDTWMKVIFSNKSIIFNG